MLCLLRTRLAEQNTSISFNSLGCSSHKYSAAYSAPQFSPAVQVYSLSSSSEIDCFTVKELYGDICIAELNRQAGYATENSVVGLLVSPRFSLPGDVKDPTLLSAESRE